MKCKGNFKFRGIEKRDAGQFTNNKGQLINYDSKYAVQLDELTPEGKVYTRTFKVDLNSPIISELAQLKLYQDITVEFNVELYASGSKVIPVALVK